MDIDASAPLLFDGLKIVEIGQYIAAPYAAELFAHGGADVVSIEPVDGGPTRHNDPIGTAGDGRQYLIKARGKRALPVNLSTPQGQKILLELTADADILISNLRPNLADSIGLGWEDLSKQNPRLIYAEVRGFGFDGPISQRACVDLVAQASSGMTRSIGRFSDGRSTPLGVMIADYTAGTLLAFAIASALHHRHSTGRGQKVATSLLSACLVAQHRQANRFDQVDHWHQDLESQTAMVGHDDANDLEQITNWRQDKVGVAPYFYNIYGVADGEVAVGAVAANGPCLLRAAGLDPADLEHPARLKGMTVQETVDMVAAHLSNHRADDLLAILLADGVPAAKVRFLEQALADPELESAGVVQRFDHPRVGPTTMPAAPVQFSGARYQPGTDTPAFGANTDELLSQLGYEQHIIDRLVADGIVARQP